MRICALCKKEIEVDKYFFHGILRTRKAACPACGADLHICLNCKFYSETSHNKCLEPKAEFQRTRDRANFCDYFIFREGPTDTAAGNVSEDAKKRFEDLFKK